MSRGQGGETEHRYPGQSEKVTSGLVYPGAGASAERRLWTQEGRGWKGSDLDPASKPSPAQKKCLIWGRVLLGKTLDVRAGSAEA